MSPVTLHTNRYHVVVARRDPLSKGNGAAGFAAVQPLSLFYHGMRIWIGYETNAAVMTVEKATDYVRAHIATWTEARAQRLRRLLATAFPTLLSSAHPAAGSKRAWPLYTAADGGIATYDARRHRVSGGGAAPAPLPAGLAALVDEHVWIQRIRHRQSIQ